MSSTTESLRSSVGASTHESTPPTSTGGSNADEDASLTKEVSRRRSARSFVSLSTLNSVQDSEALASVTRKLARKKSDRTIKTVNGSRAVSGATLVNEEEIPGKLAKELGIDMHWKGPDGELDTTSSRRSRRSVAGASAGFAGTISSLGKRAHDLADSVKVSVTETMSSTLKRSNSKTLENAAKRVKRALSQRSQRSEKPSLEASLREVESESEHKYESEKPKCNPYAKKYQAMGLYAGQKRDSMKLSKSKSKAKGTRKNSFETEPEEQIEHQKENSILPLPMFGTYKRLTIEDGFEHFKLPYDVLNPLPKEEAPKDWHRLGKNVFKGDARAAFTAATKLQAPSYCYCQKECGEDCLNRHMEYECTDMTCNVGEDCGNRPFAELKKRQKSKNDYRLRPGEKPESSLFGIGVETFKTAGRGHGVRAMRPFKAGQVIVEYCGEIIDTEECDRRMMEDYKGKEVGNHYLMEFKEGLLIDAGTRGSICRFVNHSCSPNCRVKMLLVDGEPRIMLFAGDDPIMTGEELTYDYNFENFSAKSVQECKCGASNCRGILGPTPKDREAKPKTTKMVEAVKRQAQGATKAVKRGIDVILGRDDSDEEHAATKQKRVKVESMSKSAWNKMAKSVSKVDPAPTAPSDPTMQIQKASRQARAKRAADRTAIEDLGYAKKQEDEAKGRLHDEPKGEENGRRGLRHSISRTSIPVTDIPHLSPKKTRITYSKRDKMHNFKDRLVKAMNGKNESTRSSRVTSQTRLLPSGFEGSVPHSKTMRQSHLSFASHSLSLHESSKKSNVDDPHATVNAESDGEFASGEALVTQPGSNLKTKGPRRSSTTLSAKLMVKGARKFAVAAKLGLKGDKAVRRKIRTVSGAE